MELRDFRFGGVWWFQGCRTYGSARLEVLEFRTEGLRGFKGFEVVGTSGLGGFRGLGV